MIASPLALLAQNPDVCGGRPCVAGTRITVNQLVVQYKRGFSAEEINGFYMHLSLAQIYAALAYYHANKSVVDASLQDEVAETDESFRRFGGRKI